jgi:hypothetical protein
MECVSGFTKPDHCADYLMLIKPDEQKSIKLVGILDTRNMPHRETTKLCEDSTKYLEGDAVGVSSFCVAIKKVPNCIICKVKWYLAQSFGGSIA